MDRRLKIIIFKSLPLLLLAGLLFPQVTFAVWYNPTTWFKEKIVPIEKISETEIIDSEVKEEQVPKQPTKTVEKVIDNRVDTSYFINQIATLKKENAELRAKLSQCSLPTATVSGPIQVTNTTEIEKQKKLKGIDQEMFSIINNYLAADYITDECTVLKERIVKYKFSSDTIASKTYAEKCTPDVSRINELLEAYRLVDSKMNYKNISSSLDEVFKLKNYLVNTYIEYR